MRNKTEEQIEDLTKKIEELTVEVKELREKVKGDISKESKKELRVGDRVAIRNPRRGQATSGLICRIGEEYVTVNTKRGKVVRKAHNVRKVKTTEGKDSV